jgi:hypothetical protein
MDQYHCFAERWLNERLSAPDFWMVALAALRL